MQMRVRLNTMQQTMQDINQLRKQLNLCKAELESIKQDLKTISNIDIPLVQIQKCEYQLEMQSRYCMLFENAIYYIRKLYEDTEYKQVEYSENIRIVASRDVFANRNLKGMASIFYKVLQKK